MERNAWPRSFKVRNNVWEPLFLGGVFFKYLSTSPFCRWCRFARADNETKHIYILFLQIIVDVYIDLGTKSRKSKCFFVCTFLKIKFGDLDYKPCFCFISLQVSIYFLCNTKISNSLVILRSWNIVGLCFETAIKKPWRWWWSIPKMEHLIEVLVKALNLPKIFPNNKNTVFGVHSVISVITE